MPSTRIFLKHLLFCILSLLAISECTVTNGNMMKSLRCLGMNRKSGCRILSGEVPPFERLQEIYTRQSRRVKDALDFGRLNTLNKQDLISIDPVILLLIPASELSNLKGEDLAYLMAYWSSSRVLVHHIVQAASLSNERSKFFLKLQGVNIPEENLDLIGESIINWDHMIHHGLIGNSLFAYLPLNYLYNMTHSEINKQLFFFDTWFRMGGTNWSSKSPVIKRTWAKLMRKAEFPSKLEQWKDSDLEKMGSVLIGLTTHELNELECSNFKEKTSLFKFNFTEVQVRMLFRKCFDSMHLSSDDFKSLTPILGKLTPKDLQMFNSDTVDFHGWKSYPKIVSLATAKQIVEYLKLEGFEQRILNRSATAWSGQSVKILGRFIYPVDLSSLKGYRDNPLTLSQVMPLLSDLISPAQAYYLTGKGSKLNAHDPYAYSSLLHALPSSSLPPQLSYNNLLLLLKHMPLDNKIRAFKLINQLWSHLGEKKITNVLLKNRSPELLLDMIPVKAVYNNSKKLLSSLASFEGGANSVLGSLPEIMLTQLYRVHSSESPPINSHQGHLNFLILGITCQDVDQMPVEEFIFKISQFNQLLRKTMKPFPKSLQECCTSKLIKYLKMKSFLIQQFHNEDLLDLLTDNEAQAVGGFVLSFLSAEDIEFSKITKTIIKLIGKLSLPELIISSPPHKLRTMIKVYRNEFGSELGRSQLFDLGNLTLFLPKESISSINPSDFKLILESKYVDRRICAGSEARKAWAKLIAKSFGEPSTWGAQEIEILGEMMIVFPESELEKVNLTSLSDTVDVLKPGYCDMIQWHQMTKFYQVCITNILGNGEKNEYINSIKVLTKLLIKGAQAQLNTIKFASEFDSFLSDAQEPSVLLTSIESNYVPLEDVYKTSVTKRDAVDHTEKIGKTVATESGSKTTDNYFLNISNVRTDSTVASSSTNDRKNDATSPTTESTQSNDTSNLKTEDSTVGSSRSISSKNKATSPVTESSRKQISNLRTEDSTVGTSNPISIKNKAISPIIESSHKHISNLGTEDSTVRSSSSLSSKNDTISSTEVASNNPEIVESSMENFLFSNNTTSGDFTKDVTTRGFFIPKESLDLTPEDDGGIQIMKDVFTNDFLLPDLSLPNAPPELPKVNLEMDLNTVLKEVYEKRPRVDLSHQDKDLMLEPSLKRSTRQIDLNDFKEITCDALRIVGPVVELSINRVLLRSLTDSDLENCVEFFGKMDLSLSDAKSIWKQLAKEDLHLKGKLIKAAEVADLKGLDLNFTTPWALETIYLLSKHNLNLDVAKFLIDQVNLDTHLSIEEVHALGPFLCQLDEEQLEKAVNPETVDKISKILGQGLHCDIPCLERFTNIILKTTNISNWTSIEASSYGILLAGLDIKNWEKLLSVNKNILYEIDVNTAMCLREEYLKMIPKEMVWTMPYYVRESLTSYYKIHPLSSQQRKAFTTYHSYKITSKSSLISSSARKSTSLLFNIYIVSFTLYLSVSFCQFS